MSKTRSNLALKLLKAIIPAISILIVLTTFILMHGDNSLKLRFRQQTRFSQFLGATNPELLLIIIFNSDKHYENVGFLQEIYSFSFPRMVFYGPSENTTFGVRKMADVSGHGYCQQQTIAQAYRENPNYRGYLWIGDDVLICSKTMLKPRNGDALRLNKVWAQFPGPHLSYQINNLPHYWHWWHMIWPVKRINGIVADTRNDLLRIWNSTLPDRIRHRIHVKFGGEILKAVSSDVGYIPATLMEEFAVLAETSPLNNILFEVFIPTFSRLLSDELDDVQLLNGLYLWGHSDRYNWSTLYNSSAMDFVHPVKFSQSEEVETSLHVLESCKPT